MNNIRVVFMGTPEFSVPVLEGLIANYNVVGVVTQPDKEVGRGREIVFSPVKKVALEHDIKVLQPVKIRNNYSEVLELKPDLIVTCAYGQIIPKEILDYPKYKCVNVHASLLPKYRGGAPMHRAIMNGEKETGITIMYMAEGIDDGDILTQEKIEITNDMNVGELHDKLCILGRDLLLKTLPSLLDGKITPIKQDESKVVFGKIIKKEDEVLNFGDKTINIYNKIRGLSPVPCSYTTLDGKVLKVYKARTGDSNKEGKTGEVINIYKDGIGIKTLDGEIVLEEVKLEGKKKMDVRSFLNGFDKKNLIGKVLGDSSEI